MSVDVAAHLVRIHINREAYESPNPTNGEALYTLGNIPKPEKLYREVGGDKEDKLVPRHDAHVHLTEDEHFYLVARRRALSGSRSMNAEP